MHIEHYNRISVVIDVGVVRILVWGGAVHMVESEIQGIF